MQFKLQIYKYECWGTHAPALKSVGEHDDIFEPPLLFAKTAECRAWYELRPVYQEV